MASNQARYRFYAPDHPDALNALSLSLLTTEMRQVSRVALKSNPTYDDYCKLEQEGILEHITTLTPEHDQVKRLLPEFGNCPLCMSMGLIYLPCSICSNHCLPAMTSDMNIVNPRFITRAFLAAENVPYERTNTIPLNRRSLVKTEEYYNQVIPAMRLDSETFDKTLKEHCQHHSLGDLTPQMKMLRAMMNSDYTKAYKIYKDNKEEIRGSEYYDKIYMAVNPWGTHLPVTQQERVGQSNELVVRIYRGT